MPLLNINLLKPGMTIERDIFTKNYQLVICKDTIITENIIKRLKHFNIKDVFINDENNKNISREESFKIFQQSYKNIEIKIESALNDIIKKEYSKENIENIINESLELYNTQSSTLMLIKMIQLSEGENTIFQHSLNVASLSMLIAKWSGKTQDECKLIFQCGLFHDIGKLLMPQKLLNKNSSLTINEYAQIKTHTLEGYNLLKSLDMNKEIANSALLHHERIDGSGYPLKLKNNQIDNISNISKIIALADVYDAMTNNRSYRDAFCPFSVFEELEKDGIGVFDTTYLMIFLKNIINNYINNEVLLSDGTIGKIIMINNTSLSRPIIQINNDFIDLSKYKKEELTINKLL